MSKNFNNITITGRLTADAEINDVGEHKVCKFRVAVNRTEEITDFINVKVWNNYAESLFPYLKKGKFVLVNGALNIDEVNDGDTRQWFTSVNAKTVNFLSNKDA
jgi:single-strand DNA-binding protein